MVKKDLWTVGWLHNPVRENKNNNDNAFNILFEYNSSLT